MEYKPQKNRSMSLSIWLTLNTLSKSLKKKKKNLQTWSYKLQALLCHLGEIKSHVKQNALSFQRWYARTWRSEKVIYAIYLILKAIFNKFRY